MRTKALFDIRHDFIKHSSNVQTLYIELYLRPLGAAAASPPSLFLGSTTLDDSPRPAARSAVRSVVHPVPCLPPKTYRVLP